jgi:hypothetical protein
MGTKLLRPYQIYGDGNPLPFGKTWFWENVVYREGGDNCIPGTDIPRLRLIKVSDRIRVALEDEVSNIAEAFRARRDAA